MADAEFLVRRRVFSLFGNKFEIFKPDGSLLGFSRQKVFKLKEDIRVYTDTTCAEELLAIQARSIIDFGAAYDVVDSRDGTKLGALRRKGLKSIFRDEWKVMDESDNEIGSIQEDNAFLAMVRRMIVNLIPQNFTLRTSDGDAYATFRQHFNPFVQKLTVTVFSDCPVNPMLVVSAAMLLVVIEGRQTD